MRAVRRHLGALIGAWLMCHSATLAIAPVAMCAANRASATGQVCTCGDAHDAGQACPMHHRTTHPSPSSCSCRSTTDLATTAISSLLGPVAVLSRPIGVAASLLSTASRQRVLETPLDAG